MTSLYMKSIHVKRGFTASTKCCTGTFCDSCQKYTPDTKLIFTKMFWVLPFIVYVTIAVIKSTQNVQKQLSEMFTKNGVTTSCGKTIQSGTLYCHVAVFLCISIQHFFANFDELSVVWQNAFFKESQKFSSVYSI